MTINRQGILTMMSVQWILVVLVSVFMFATFSENGLMPEQEAAEVASVIAATVPFAIYYIMEAGRDWLGLLLTERRADIAVAVIGSILVTVLTVGNIREFAYAERVHIAVGVGIILMMVSPMLQHTAAADRLNERFGGGEAET